jgi:hypothetical protein
MVNLKHKLYTFLCLFKPDLFPIITNQEVQIFLKESTWAGDSFELYKLWFETLVNGDNYEYRFEHPYPWIAFDAIFALEKWLMPEMSIFEYGAGTSTLWYSKRVSRVISVEYDQNWYKALKNRLSPSVNLIYAPSQPMQSVNPMFSSEMLPNRSFEEYVKSIDAYPDGSFNLVCIDGRARPGCSIHAKPKVAQGGFILFDNYTRPRYKAAIDNLVGDGWQMETYCSNGPYTARLENTAIFQKP